MKIHLRIRISWIKKKYTTHKLILFGHTYVISTLFSSWLTCLPDILRLLASCPEDVSSENTSLSLSNYDLHNATKSSIIISELHPHNDFVSYTHTTHKTTTFVHSLAGILQASPSFHLKHNDVTLANMQTR